MEILVLQPIVALIAGILILIFPRLLNYFVAVYLILIGLVGLFAVSEFLLFLEGHVTAHFARTPLGRAKRTS